MRRILRFVFGPVLLRRACDRRLRQRALRADREHKQWRARLREEILDDYEHAETARDARRAMMRLMTFDAAAEVERLEAM